MNSALFVSVVQQFNEQSSRTVRIVTDFCKHKTKEFIMSSLSNLPVRARKYLALPCLALLAACGAAPADYPARGPLGTPVTDARAFSVFERACLRHGPDFFGSRPVLEGREFGPIQQAGGQRFVVHTSEDITASLALSDRDFTNSRCGLGVRSPNDLQDFLDRASNYGNFLKTVETRRARAHIFKTSGQSGYFLVGDPIDAGNGMFQIELIALNFIPEAPSGWSAFFDAADSFFNGY